MAQQTKSRQRTTTAKRKTGKKKVRRKLHKGRTFSAAAILAGLICCICFLCTNHGADASTSKGNSGPVPEAIECGRNDARNALAAPAGSMERESALLFIRARENRLRQNGYIHAAEDYITGAEEILKPAGIAE